MLVALYHVGEPLIRKPAEPPALHQGSARKSTAGAGCAERAAARAGFRCGFGGVGGVGVGGAVDAPAKRSASPLVSGASLSWTPSTTSNEPEALRITKRSIASPVVGPRIIVAVEMILPRLIRHCIASDQVRSSVDERL
jgi:hypothetical protein